MSIQKAMAFAVRAHAGQYDKQGRPYHKHVRKVAAHLLECDEHIVMAACLHDVLEDTDTTYGQILVQFGVRVADLVETLTRAVFETYGDYIDRLCRNGSDEVLLIKMADLQTNLSDLPDHMYTLKSRYVDAGMTIHNELQERKYNANIQS